MIPISAISQKKRYYEEVDVLRGISIFLVVLGHSIILVPVNLHLNPTCEAIYQWLFSVHVPLFFVLSGFCFSYNGDYRSYITKKAKRVLIPYLVFNLLDMVPRFLFPQLVNRSRSVWESVSLMVFRGEEYWFLYVLFFIFLLYPVVYPWITKQKHAVFVLLAGLFITSYLMTDIIVWRVYEILYYGFYFTLGVCLKMYQKDNLFPVKFSAPVTLLLAAVTFSAWIGELFFLRSPFLLYTTALLGCVTFYLLTKFQFIRKIFRPFGPYTLQLYLLNGFALVFSRTIICSVLGVENPLIIVLFNMLVCFGCSYLGIRYICAKIPFVRTLMGMN